MKLFVWEHSERYETFLAVAIAEDSESARKLVVNHQGFTSDYLAKSPYIYDLEKLEEFPIVFVASHSG